MRPNLLVGVVSVLIGATYTAQAFMLPKAMVGNPWAPLYFPIGLGLLMIALGTLLIVLEVRKAVKGVDDYKRPKFTASSIKLIAGTSAACVTYALIFEDLGFIPSSLLFLGSLLSMINGLKAWKINGVITLGFTFGAWFTFVKIFQINLP
ncbi:tripartite tricarboxylate transporter TctB family protein [Thermanaerovibrio acidaminovorans]|uniref:tripartite tricarboxylate transporter TctB family protein n=1 Tax=Thermanaerovibrio acidaminovorans TaxID=81462 RepID=UPI002490B502|nr:tripartite tricarboxylate transporter TctB family protein [Thermanaerovibrio acidaminovorans]